MFAPGTSISVVTVMHMMSGENLLEGRLYASIGFAVSGLALIILGSVCMYGNLPDRRPRN